MLSQSEEKAEWPDERRTRQLTAPAVGAEDVIAIHEEATANHGRVTLVADETVTVPVALFERDELGSANA